MTTLESYKEELTSVRAAIKKLTDEPMTSTSVSSANGGSYSASAVNLTTLHARERELITMIAEIYRESHGGGTFCPTYPIYCGG